MTGSGQRLVDRQQIVEVSLNYAAGIDHRDWARYRDCFADPCRFDFSSWSGRPAAVMPADEWVAAVRSVNGSFDATQHLMTNHDIRFDGDDTAVGVNELQAQHWFSPESMVSFGRPAESAWCLLGGHYTNRYERLEDGWRISECRLTVRWHIGDRSIFELARRR
jgi:hypothetical protein